MLKFYNNQHADSDNHNPHNITNNRIAHNAAFVVVAAFFELPCFQVRDEQAFGQDQDAWITLEAEGLLEQTKDILQRTGKAGARDSGPIFSPWLREAAPLEST